MAEPVRVITQTESWHQEVQTSVVSALRGLLARAEAGEIQGIAYSCSCVDNTVLTGSTMTINQSAVIGGLERIKFRMLNGKTD